MSDPTVELIDVSRVHGTGEAQVRALEGINLAVHPGELLAVMGPSGSGKSTLLNLAGGLDTATSGQVRIAGTDITALNSPALAQLRRRTVGFVFQDFNLVSSLTAAENIGLPLELDGVSPARVFAAARGALESVGLTALADRFPHEMSGGQRQRIALCRALIGSRSLVLADEPTGAVDSVTGEDLLRLLRKQIDAGAAGILVTHESRHAAWADRIVYLRDGHIVDHLGAASSPHPPTPAGAHE